MQNENVAYRYLIEITKDETCLKKNSGKFTASNISSPRMLDNTLLFTIKLFLVHRKRTEICHYCSTHNFFCPLQSNVGTNLKPT